MGNLCDIFKASTEKPTAKFQTILQPKDIIMSPIFENKSTLLENSAIPIHINPHKSLKKVSITDFTIVRALGQGAFGKVLLVKKEDKKTSNSKLFAMKIIRKADILNNRLTENIKLEKKILEYQRYSFLVHLKFAFQTNSKIYLVMEYLPGGSLGKFLRRQKRFNEDLTIFYSAEILLALEYLHKEMGVIYRDLKPDNILLNSNGHIKITDFGLAKEESEGDLAYTFAGTPEYLAPEILLGKGHTHVADYWSLGILIYEMLSGRTPFAVPSGNVTEVIQKILENQLKIPAYFNESSIDLIQKLLEKDPNKRLGVNGTNEIKSNKFYKDVNWKELSCMKTKPPVVRKSDKNPENFEGETVSESINNQTPMPYLSKMTYNTEMGKTLTKSVVN